MALETIDYEGEKLYSAKYDRIFKAEFGGDSEGLELLASFLSCILDVGVAAENIVVDNSEVAADSKDDKQIRLDFIVTLADGSVVNIEMQVGNKRDMGKRSLYNLSRLMARQIGRQDEYKKLCPVIAINILDFDYLERLDSYHNRFRMKEVERNVEMSDAEYFEVNYIELPKLPEDAGDSMKELWVKFLSAKTEEDLKMLAMKKSIFRTAVSRLLRINASKRIRNAMERRDKRIRDYVSELGEQFDNGVEKAKNESAKKMKEKGCDSAFITEITGLSAEQIEQL